MVLPLCPSLVRWVQCWASQDKRDRNALERAQRRTVVMVKGVEHRSHKERPRAETAQPGEKTARLKRTRAVCTNT